MTVRSIIVAGKNNIATEACKYISKNYPQLSLYVIPNRNDEGVDTFQESLLAYSSSSSVEVITLDQASSLEGAVFLSLEFDQIVCVESFDTRRLYNIHFSALPAYKGMYTSALPLLHGVSKSGVTLHRIDSGIDTGEIVDQEILELKVHFVASDLYAEYTRLGLTLLKRNLPAIISDSVESRPQSQNGSSYFDRYSIDYSNIVLNFRATACQVLNQIRAYSFRCYQLPTWQESTISNAEVLESRSMQKPGSTLLENEFYMDVATIDYDIRVFKDRLDDVFEWIRTEQQSTLRSYLIMNSGVSNVRNERGWTPIIVAAYYGNRAAIDCCIEFGSAVNDTNYRGTTVLMYAKDYALRSGDFSFFEYILSLGASPDAIDISGRAILDYLDKTDSDHERVITLLEGWASGG